MQRGRELGYVMGDEQFNSILANLKKQNNLEDDAKFQAALKQEGITMAELRQQLRAEHADPQVQRAERQRQDQRQRRRSARLLQRPPPRVHHAGGVDARVNC